MASTNSQVRFVSAPALTSEADGVLLQPAQVLDDYTEKVNEVSPTFTILNLKCNTESEFDAKTALNVHSFNFALPHIVKTATNEFAQDARGQLVELLRVGVSFKNVTNQDVEVHANLPLARQISDQKVFTRISGFRVKMGKKSMLVDDIVLKPGQTGTFKVNVKALANEYVPMQNIIAKRSWVNMIAFCVVTKNINLSSGDPFSDSAAILEARPKAMYTRRKNHPVVDDLVTINMQSKENFQLNALGGFSDLYEVFPVDVTGSKSPDSGEVYNSFTIFEGESNCMMIRQQCQEGDLMGYQTLPLSEDRHIVGLTVRRLGGALKPLTLEGRQDFGNRLIIPGLNINFGNIHEQYDGPMSGPITSYWRFDPALGYWCLFDESKQENAEVIHPLDKGTYVSSLIPIILMDGVYTKEQREAKMKALIETGGTNLHGLSFGLPDVWGSKVRASVSTVEVVGKISGNV